MRKNRSVFNGINLCILDTGLSLLFVLTALFFMYLIYLFINAGGTMTSFEGFYVGQLF